MDGCDVVSFVGKIGATKVMGASRDCVDGVRVGHVGQVEHGVWGVCDQDEMRFSRSIVSKSFSRSFEMPDVETGQKVYRTTDDLNRSFRLGKMKRFVIRASLLRGNKRLVRFAALVPRKRLARITKRLIFSSRKDRFKSSHFR